MAAGELAVPAHPDSRFRTGMAGPEKINVKGLEAELRRRVSASIPIGKYSSGWASP